MIKTSKQLLLLSALLLGSFGVQANLQQQFIEAKDAFDTYLQEDDGSFDTVWQQFERLDEQYPNHPAVQMYYGSLETIKARDAFLPWKKMKWVEQGLDRMDRALSLIKVEHEQERLGKTMVALDSRLVAANTFLGVPSFLNRLQDAKDVFADLMETPDLEHMPPPLKQAIYAIGLKIAEKEENPQELANWQQKIEQLNP